MGTLSTPSNANICSLLLDTIPAPFAQSIGLPPPTTTVHRTVHEDFFSSCHHLKSMD